MKTASLDNPRVMLLLGLGLVVAFVLLVCLPLQRQTAVARDSLALKQSIVAQEGSLKAQIIQHESELAELHSFTAHWPEVENANFELSRLLGEISQQAKLAGAESLRLEPGPLVSMKSLDRSVVRLGCRGTFQEIHHLLRQLESLPDQLWVHRIELAPQGADSHELSCEIEFETFTVSAKNSH